MGVVLGLEGSGVVHLAGYLYFSSYVAVFRVRGAPPPLGVGAFSLFSFNFGVGSVWPSVSKKKKKKDLFSSVMKLFSFRDRESIMFFLKCF